MWRRKRRRMERAARAGEGGGASWGDLVVYFRKKTNKQKIRFRRTAAPLFYLFNITSINMITR